MRMTFLGTGDARQVPVFGCDCAACRRANTQPEYRRDACCALLETDDYRLLLDAGRHDLADRFQPTDLQAICLTHYHMDHVSGLFRMRWGIGDRIPVHGPDDERGCDDLYKHPGLLDFQPALTPGEPLTLGPFRLWPLPLNHSRRCLGYGIEWGQHRLAYLTDTVGLPKETENFLLDWGEFTLVIDTTFPPQAEPPRNHNDLNLTLAIVDRLRPKATWLTHLGHEMDRWLIDTPNTTLPAGVEVARDGLTLEWD